MNKLKKGFTLTEILVVIVIIGVIVAIAIPAALSIGKSIRLREYESKMESYVAAAELYGKNNKDAFGTNVEIEISVETLLANGYIDKDETCARSFGCVNDPRDKETILNDEKITLRINKSIVRASAGPMMVDVAVNFALNGASLIGANSIGCEAENGKTCPIVMPTITRDGYTIIGWATTSSATTATYNVGSTINISQLTDGMTYYAITSKSLIATFDKNTTSSISKTSANCTIYNTQTSCDVTSGTISSTSGYYVVGWNTNPSATTKQYNSGATIPVATNITYYAIQKPYVTCYKAATSTPIYYCSTGDLSGSQCVTSTTITSYNTTVDRGSQISTTAWFDYTPTNANCLDVLRGHYGTGTVACTGGGTYAYCCGSVSSSYGTLPGVVTCKGLPVDSCERTPVYGCSSGWTLSGSYCYKTASISSYTYTCPTGGVLNTTDNKCYLTLQTSCSAGWTQQ